MSKKSMIPIRHEGFDIIGISLDTDEERLRTYLQENEIPWRQVFSGKGWIQSCFTTIRYSRHTSTLAY